jgi:Relaxase/Mobilisation nuclease domain
MIAKIMQSSNSFQAVYYNEQKVVEQKAELLAAVNFEGNLTAVDFWQKADYIKYFNDITQQNSRVKRKQFHAVISTKGHEHTADELKIIAEEYIKRMGYGDNPYLIYFHQDTNNNHVHIVSTRVNTEGIKVKDSFEKKESLRHIGQIMQAFNRQELGSKNIIDGIMQYNFTTEAQLNLLIEQRGYEAKTDEKRDLIILENNRNVATIPRSDIAQKLKIKPDDARKKQLKAILLKYKDKPNLEEFLKDKFGVDLIFHRGEGKETPYGYTLIDNASKQVFKGSEVLKLSEFFKGVKNMKNDGSTEQQKPHHIESLEGIQAQGKEKVEDYMDTHDLFVIQKGNDFFLLDRANNETHNVSNYAFIAEHSFMDLKDAQRVEKIEVGSNINLSFSAENDSETDRKRKSNKMRNGY